MDVQHHGGVGRHVFRGPGLAAVARRRQGCRRPDPAARPHRHPMIQHTRIDEGRLQDVDGADTLDRRAVDHDRLPALATVARAIQRRRVRDIGEIVRPDIAEKAPLLIDEAERPHKGAGPVHLLDPGLAAVSGPEQLAGPVAVPAGQGVNETDVVLFAAIGLGRQSDPAGRGILRPSGRRQHGRCPNRPEKHPAIHPCPLQGSGAM